MCRYLDKDLLTTLEMNLYNVIMCTIKHVIRSKQNKSNRNLIGRSTKM
ncbi:hypothetical protein [Candidatus Hodgkinia cicadicola]